jgi:glycosyltransferase involved in cell wall biosynthesis
MKILMLLAGQDFPPDNRVEREAKALANEGHKVSVLASNYANMPSRELWHDDISIVRLTNLPKILLGMDRRFPFILFIDLQWLLFVYWLVSQEGIEVLHVHDLPMARTAWLVARLKKARLVLDLHENYPVVLHAHLSISPKYLQSQLLKRLRRWRNYEKWSISKVDRVIVVIEEARKRLTEELGYPANKITVVSNTVDVDEFCSYPIDDKIDQQYAGDFLVSYIGGSGPHRGLDTAIEAMPSLLEKMPNARLLLVGVSQKAQEFWRMLQKLSEDLGVSDRVTFLEWQDFSKVPSWIEASKVGLIPHRRNAHTNATIPNKLFHYMCLGKPVVVSDCRPLKRIVRSSRSGLVFEAGNPQALSAVLRKLEDDELRAELGANGREAVRRLYNWQQEARKLVQLYQELEGARQ